MSAAEKILPSEDPIRLSALAKEHLTAAGGDTKKALASLLALLKQNPAVLRAVAEEALKLAAGYSVEHAMRSERQSILTLVRRDMRDNSAAHNLARAAARNEVKRLLDYPLANGLRLADAMREDVLYQAQIHAGPVRAHAANVRWLTAIAQGLKEGARVSDAFTEERLRDLRESADQSVADFFAGTEI